VDIIVGDRLFVVGLSELFRHNVKIYEATTLLPLAETACKACGLSPAPVPVEGYYSESQELSRFFRLIRALQIAELRPASPGSAHESIQRLRNVFYSPAMGRAEENGRVLPRNSSPFGEALRTTEDWSIEGLSLRAQRLVRDDDAGLVAVASATGDPVAICVARESVALTAEVEMMAEPDVPRFKWAVSPQVAEIAGRFISVLAQATGLVLPEAVPSSAAIYGQAARDADLIGRCILVGKLPGLTYPLYHWYIKATKGEPTVKDFWSTALWTTQNLRRLPANQRPTAEGRLGAPEPENESPADGRSSPRNSAAKPEGGLERKGWLARLFQRREP